VTVQLPVAVAANVCDVDVAILLAAIQDTGTANCTATAVFLSGETALWRSGGRRLRQALLSSRKARWVMS